MPAAASLIAFATLPCLAGLRCIAQTVPPSPPATPPSVAGPATGPFNRAAVVLDPAHGGIDSGSRIGESLLEKNVTLAIAFRLRSLLTARGFSVVMTRDSDSAVEPGPAGNALTLDDRAGIMNHARGAACLSLHATGSGQGVHLYSSELPAAAGEAAVLPWLTAQAAWVPESRGLERRVGDSLTRAGIPLVLSSASVRPVDSLTCPALVVEVAPRSDDPKSINDSSYQQRVAEALAAALLFWRDEAQPPIRLAAAPSPGGAAAGTSVISRRGSGSAGSEPGSRGRSGSLGSGNPDSGNAGAQP